MYAGEEAINYREEKLKKVEEENLKIKEELNNVVPVLKAQVRGEGMGAGEWDSQMQEKEWFQRRLTLKM